MSDSLTAARPGLSSTALKGIALVLMVMDHVHYFFEFTGVIPLWFSLAGRLAAPLFLFCTVEGFAHTHDRRRYFWRIWGISAGMGLLQFLMMYAGLGVRPDGFFPMNAIFMNFTILIPVWQGIDWLRQRRLARGIIAVILPLAWPFGFVLLCSLSQRTSIAWLLDSLLALLAYTALPCWFFIIDGGIFYIMIGIALYLLRDRRKMQATVYVVLTLAFYFFFPLVQLLGTGDFHVSLMFTLSYEWLGAFAVIFMLMYNGQRGRGLKHFFYIFFPVHVYLLYALSWGVLLLTA